MTPSTRDRYEQQRHVGANTLLAIQRPDKGWGLSPKGASSIVNTAEALSVLRAADLGVSSGAKDGANYIPQALEMHYGRLTNQVSPIRGGNTRYLTFGMDGLVTIPEVGLNAGLDGIDFCIRHIAKVQDSNGGILADIDDKLPSYHQTARALISISKLALTAGAKEVVSAETWEQAERIADMATSFLLAGQDGYSGAWRVRPVRSSPLDPAKTAVATTALSYRRLLRDDQHLQARVLEGAEWLLGTYASWLRTVSADSQESGSDWQHLNYAECARAIASVRPDAVTLLSKSWTFMLKCWYDARNEDEISLWREPKRNITIRAAYHTVMAFETSIDRSLLTVPAPVEQDERPTLDLEAVSEGVYLASAAGRSWVIEMGEKPAQNQLLKAVANAPDGITLRDLGELLGGISNDAVSVYKKRVNDSVREQSGGAIAELVEKTGRDAYRITPRLGGS